ncbi:MAG TPA: ADOP family duplicated permease [Bryobacteraceae bacterium]
MLSLVWQAWRSWKSAKAVALLAVLALAVGIGSTTAIYTVIHAVLLKPLPYQHGERFVALYGARFSEPGQRSSLPYPDVLAYQQRTHSFDVFGWFRPDEFNLTSPGQPQHLNGIDVTPTLAANLGVNPILGRWFRNGDTSFAVISNALWQRLGGRPDILGQPLVLNGRSYTVTGVMPPWFRLPVGGPGAGQTRNDVWLPLDPRVEAQDLLSGVYFCYGRLKPGVTFTQAQADVKSVAARIAREDPAGHPSYTAQLDDLREAVVQEARPTLLLLLGAAGLLLLITCANVAGLLVARSVARSRETAVRVALGAAQGQLALQYFSEGLLVALTGAAAGVLLSFALVHIVVSLAAEHIPRADEIAADWTVLLFALGAACLASVLSSLAPLWQAIRTLPNEVLSDGARASESMRHRKLSQSLVIAEIAVAFTLLAVSAVLIAHLENLAGMRPGFDPDRLLTFQLDVPEAQYGTAAKLRPYQNRLLRALESIPAVQSATFSNQLPLAGCCFSTTIYPEGRTITPKAVQRITFLVAGPGYLPTMRIPLLKGRFLKEQDTSENPTRAVIDQAAARYYWPNRDPVGAYARVGGPSGDRVQVVGVVGDVRNDGLDNPTVPEIYFSNAVYALQRMHFLVRSALSEKTLTPEIRRAIQSVDAAQPIHDVETMNEVVTDSLSLQRVSSFMTGFFAVAALLLATLGVYGVVAYSVRQRTVEIGTRMALGATRRDLMRLVIGGGVKMAAYGVAIGGVAVVTAVWLLVKALKISDLDPRSFIYSTALIAGVAAVASFFPAWRATLLSPLVAIRNEPGSMWQSTKRGLRQVVSQLVSRADEDTEISEATLVSGLIEAVRHAESFPAALDLALTTVCEKIRAQSALLLENDASQTKGFLLSRFRFYSSPLPLGEGDYDTWLRWAGEQKREYVAEIERLRETKARLAVPLRTRKEILGVLLLGPPLARNEYSAVQRHVLGNCAQQFALLIENARLTDRVVEQEKLRRDLALAAEVQRRLLPDKPPGSAAMGIAAVSVPARSVGGDYYDFLEVGGHQIGIALADIAGKGVAAALIMSVVQASLRIISAEGNVSLPELAAKMNRFLYRSTGSNSYATFFYAQVDEHSRQLRYVNAGHNPPYLLRFAASSAPEIEELATGGTIIGMFPHANYEEASVPLQSGDVLVVFTDGVTEALNPREEEFGEERLQALLRRVAHLPVDEMSTHISRELKDWIDDAAQYDDLTFIVMKVN